MGVCSKVFPKVYISALLKNFLREVFKKVFNSQQMKNFLKTFALQLEKHPRLLYYV